MTISRFICLLCSVGVGVLTAGLPARLAASQTMLEAIVIESAGLASTDAEKTGSTYTVITGEELEQRQIRHAADALRQVAGVAINQSGGAGTLTQARIRGAEGNQVTVLIDGVEVNSLGGGDFDFATLLATDIDRIEVLKGPQSGVYGANALAGVINIVTKKGSGTPQVTTRTEAGSFNTHEVSASASGGSDKGYVNVSAASRETNGFNIARNGKEADGSEQQTIFARAGLALTDHFRLDTAARYQSNNTDIDEDLNFDGILDDAPGSTSKTEQKFARITAELDLLDKHWTHKAFADYLEDNLDSASIVSAFTSANRGDRAHYGYETAFTFDTSALADVRHTLIGLIEHRDETFSGRGSYASFPAFNFDSQAERSQTGLVAEYRAEIVKQLFLSGNIRRDDNETFEDATTYRATAAYLLPATRTRFHASYGKGITNPTFFEQFGSMLNFHGNPNLQPEESTGWDLGVEQKLLQDRLSLDITYFNANLRNEISGFGDTVINLDGQSQRQGVEVQLAAKPVNGLTISASYTYTDAVQPVSAADGITKGEFEEVRRPKHAANLNASYSFLEGRGLLSAGLTYNGRMKDVDFDFLTSPAYVTLDDYLLVNVAASYKLNDQVTLFGRVENLLDQNYEEVFGYSSAPIAAYAGVRISFAGAAQLEPAQ